MTLRVNLKFKITCPRHRSYNPVIHGETGIKGGCLHCYKILGIYQTAIGFQDGARKFADEIGGRSETDQR